MLVHELRLVSCVVPADEFIPGFAAITEPVETGCETISGEGLDALIHRGSHHVVIGYEAICLRAFPLAGRVAVVYPVMPPVVEEAYRPGSLVIVVVYGECRDSASYFLVAFQQGLSHRPWIGCIEMGQVKVGSKAPSVSQLVTQFAVATVLLEIHIVPMSVGAVIRTRDGAGETPFADSVRQLALQSVVRAVSCVQAGLYAVFTHPAGHDVNDSSHGVRAIEHGSRPAENFHSLGYEGLV